MAVASSRHYRWVFAGAALMAAAVVALFVVSPPQIDSDILGLLPQKNPVVQDFRTVTADFKSLDYLFVLLRSSDPKRPVSDFEDFADAYAEQLRKDPAFVEGVEYRLQDYLPLLEEVLPYTLLYLSPEELGDVAARFSDSEVRAQVAHNRHLLANPASLLTKQLIQYDPFGLIPVLKTHFAGKSRQLNVDISDGYYISKGGPGGEAPALLLIVRPTKPAQDITFGRDLMARVRGIEAGLRAEWAKEGEDLAPLKVEYGGGYPIAQSDADLIKRDAVMNTVSSALLVLGVVLWSFRRKSALAYLWLPLFLGLLLTFGVAHLLGITLNSATAGFGALLIGLGIDFATMLYGRYIELRNRGVDVENSLAAMMGRTGKGVFLGALTTSCTFGAMYVSSYRGMKQIGLLTALGILCCVLCVFLLLPAMLTYHNLHTAKRGRDPVLHMHSFGFERLGKLALRWPKLTLVVAAIVTAVLGWAALGVQFEDNIQNLRSEKNEGIRVSTAIAQEFGATLTYMMAGVEGKTPDEVVAKSAAVVAAVEPFRQRGEVLSTDSLTTYLPAADSQRAIIASLSGDTSGRFSAARVRRAFTDACLREGFDPTYFESYLSKLDRMLAPAEPLTYEKLASGPIAPMTAKYIVRRGEGDYRGVVYLYIPEGFKRFEPTGLKRAILAEVPDAKVTGINVLSRELRTVVKRDAYLSFAVGAILVILLIAADFRSMKASLQALLPLVLALIWMLGSLSLFGVPLNMINIFVTTMIIGIGSDYGIYFVHRHREPDGHDLGRCIEETGRPIAIAALTTIAGFGSMALSSYPGLRSMGYVALLGTLFSLVATLTVLVALLELLERRSPAVPREHHTPHHH